MRMHQIEVDGEVYDYLKGKAVPFVDTPNTVLRRELLADMTALEEAPRISKNWSSGPSHIPAGMPKALEHILQVVHLVRGLGRTRSDATHQVATRHGVAYQTVVDQYARQLGQTVLQFDRLLEQPGLSDLRALLGRKFGEHRATIGEYLYGLDKAD